MRRELKGMRFKSCSAARKFVVTATRNYLDPREVTVNHNQMSPYLHFSIMMVPSGLEENHMKHCTESTNFWRKWFDLGVFLLGWTWTYNTDSQVGDSGACATALLCGVKGRFETVGLDDSARYDKCQSSFNSRIPCLADWAQAEGETKLVMILLLS
ncbi:hypothetical protein AVEN_46164-1 [Araneus ventricosus]|uniref:alkaline phosphatase n=1 Tax=Araneus ventricosus TaxID=182803 RepID=A0A4Y2D7H6_ARAVE|nr:hypothetical protein AVEN_46164-1 [Araneus ventricosus]